MMKMARRSALWAVIPFLCFGMDSPQQRTEAVAAPQQQSALPPSQPPAAGSTDASKTPPATATDPAKIAAPSTPVVGAAADKSYVIGAEDVLTIQVWGDQRLSG